VRHDQGEERMKYEEFKDWVENNCMYEAFYKDSEGRSILVITELDAWVMCNKFAAEKNT
jgi:hypothetical protein